MIFSCDKSTLVNAINVASRALSSKSVNPILGGILFCAEAGEIILTSTDGSLTIQTKFAADIREEGSVVLAGKFFAEIVRRMPEGEIVCSGNYTEGVEVTGGLSKLSTAAMDAAEYPALPVIDKETSIVIRQDLLKSMVNQTVFSTALNESRPVLTGCLFEIQNEDINVVALDGYRLALRHAVIENNDQMLKAVIPARALTEITKIVNDTEETVRLYLQKSYCMIELEETKVITRLIEDEFLNYRPIIPGLGGSVITLSRLDLLESIDRAWLMVRENARNKYIVFKFEENKMMITSRSDTGNAYEEVKYSGEAAALEIGFNPEFFVDCLKNIDDEFINFCFTTPSSPAVIRPVEGDKFLYLILPVRL